MFRCFLWSSPGLLFPGRFWRSRDCKDDHGIFGRLFFWQDQYSTLEAQFRFHFSVAVFGIDNLVSFAGFVRHEELQDELSRAHIFCHPSRTLNNGDKEGIPNTILEAMATGLPVVTTRHAGIPEMVRDGEDGFVVAERDVTAIAQALLTLVKEPDLRAIMGCKATRQVQEKADAVRLTAKLEAIYDEVITSTRESRSA